MYMAVKILYLQRCCDYMKHHFEVEGNKIFLVITIKVWDGDVVNRYDVTDKVTNAVMETTLNIDRNF